MYNIFQLIIKYLYYRIVASNGRGHGIHSPFIFKFITQVLNDRQQYPAYKKVETLRKNLLRNKKILNIEDFGAGSAIDRTDRRTVASIAKNSSKSKKYGQLLYRIVNYYQPGIILELGTSLGITTSYLALANPDAKLVTLEGDKETASVADQNFRSLGLYNIKPEVGNFDMTFPTVIHDFSSIDFAFIDGNHRREPTERYFHQLLTKVHNDSILIFDDIHWSREMEQAWKIIRDHPAVRCSLDLFSLGIVLFRQEFREKQHFSIRF